MSALGIHPFSLLFAIYINDLLVEFDDNTFVSAYAGDLAMADSAHDKDMIITSLQPEVDKVVAWSAKARLPLTHPNAGQPSSVWIVQKRLGNPTSPWMIIECSVLNVLPDEQIKISFVKRKCAELACFCSSVHPALQRWQHLVGVSDDAAC